MTGGGGGGWGGGHLPLLGKSQNFATSSSYLSSKCTVPLNIHKIRSLWCYSRSCLLLRCAVLPTPSSRQDCHGQGSPHTAIQLGKASWGSSPWGVNGGCTRPKGPNHSVEGFLVNCPPLGPSGHCSSSLGGKGFSV